MTYNEKFNIIKNNNKRDNHTLFMKVNDLKELLLEIPKDEINLIEEIKTEIMKTQKLIDKDSDLIIHKFDITNIVKDAINKVQNDDSTQELFNILNYFSSIIFKKEEIEKKIEFYFEHLLSMRIAGVEKIDENNRTIYILEPLTEEDILNKNEKYNHYLEHILIEEIEFIAQIINHIINNYIIRHKNNIENDIKSLLYGSLFFDESNFESYVKTFKFLLYDNDIETSVQKLIPLLENSTKYICEQNNINPYRLKCSKKDNEKFSEESNMFGYLWKLDLFKHLFGEVIVFNILAIFDSKYGANLRNVNSHGSLSKEGYGSIIHYYAIIFVFWLCVYYKK